VNFNNFGNKKAFPSFFNKNILGITIVPMSLRMNTKRMRPAILMLFEVIYWAYYSQVRIRDSRSNEIIKNILQSGIKPQQLCKHSDRAHKMQRLYKRVDG
jgi:hypothetical protein